MVQDNKTKRYKKQKVDGGGTVTILIVTYKKPKVLKKCVASLKKNAGTGFHLWIWDNAKHNIGLNAYAEMAKDVKTDHVITLDEDVIRFPKNWLKRMLVAFYDTPLVHIKKKTSPFHHALPEKWKSPCWGWLGLNVVRDKKTNGAFWPKFLKQTRIVNSGKHKFRVGGTISQTCSMMHREILDVIGGFPTDKKPFFNFDGQTGFRIDYIGLPQGILEDVKIYHACGPYYNREYADIWKEKTGKTIKQSEREYMKRDKTLKFPL